MKKKANISIKMIIILIFIISLLVSTTCFAVLVYANWMTSAKKTTESIAAEINLTIYEHIRSFLEIPYRTNDLNRNIIANGMLDLSDTERRDRYFVDILRTYPREIYSFSYGTANGEYYGARRNKDGILEIMRNDATTGGNSWYYAVQEDSTAGERVVDAGAFDPREREWYKAAVAAKGATYSPVYPHFVMNDLAVSAAWPVYGDNDELMGVVATHILLSDIGNYLKSKIETHNGRAFIVETGTEKLIANSLDLANFDMLDDSMPLRLGLADLNADYQGAYDTYKQNNTTQHVYKIDNRNHIVDIMEIKFDGLSWMLVSAVPQSLMLADVYKSMLWAALVASLTLLVITIVYNLFTRKYLKPMDELLFVAASLSSGDLSKRVKVVRKDEIGIISESFNMVADKMQLLIENLETNVKERTDALHQANLALEENKNQLRLILDSAAEGIYGMDLEGKCTFCNISCVKLLGYKNQSELLGKEMHSQIHHSTRDGTPMTKEACKVNEAICRGSGYSSDDEVFWRADGTYFDVEYRSYPQIKNGEIIGGVVTFNDITERKQRDAQIEYLNCHDPLTGLFNRRCFEEHQPKINTPKNLPLSVIFADINGLKMTNDIFGHSAGDALIKKSAEILRSACRANDIIARIGGDEFIIILPKTKTETAEKVLARIKAGFLDAKVEAIKCSISLGCDTKTTSEQSLQEVMANAENAMYKDKTLNRKSSNKDIIDTIIGALHAKNPREKQHSIIVDKLCGEVGAALNLSKAEIGKLKRAGYLHDIGKITIEKNILSKPTITDEEERAKMRQHSVVGYRILNLFDDTLDLAEYVYNHHERWDGNGYPRGLKGEQIPLISRIISIVESYERMLNREDIPAEDRQSKAIDVVISGSGSRYDPQIVDVFVKMIRERDPSA